MAEFSFKEKTPLNLINEISKIFEDIISKHPEMKELSEKLSEYSEEWKLIVDNYFEPKCELLGYCPEKRGCGRKPQKEDK